MKYFFVQIFRNDQTTFKFEIVFNGSISPFIYSIQFWKKRDFSDKTILWDGLWSAYISYR